MPFGIVLVEGVYMLRLANDEFTIGPAADEIRLLARQPLPSLRKLQTVESQYRTIRVLLDANLRTNFHRRTSTAIFLMR